MTTAKAQKTPMLSSLRLQQDGSTAVSDTTLYRSVVGTVQYIFITWPDLSYVVNKACQFMHNPQDHHWKAIKRILCYLVGTTNHWLLIKRNSHSSILGLADVNWGTVLDDRKSTTEYAVFLCSNIVSWSSHKQKVVSRSSIQALLRF